MPDETAPNRIEPAGSSPTGSEPVGSNGAISSSARPPRRRGVGGTGHRRAGRRRAAARRVAGRAVRRVAGPQAGAGTGAKAVQGAIDHLAGRPRRHRLRRLPRHPLQARRGPVGGRRVVVLKAEFFHLGFLYKERVDIYVVADGQSKAVRYNPDMFQFDGKTQKPTDPNLGFAGFRLHARVQQGGRRFDRSVAAFVGASYFRAVAQGPGLRPVRPRAGASAPASQSRGGVRACSARSGWSSPGAGAGVDGGARAAGQRQRRRARSASRMRPGEATVFDVESVSCIRGWTSPVPGLAPLTSMFMLRRRRPRPRRRLAPGRARQRGPRSC